MHTYTSVTKFLIEADTKDFFFPLLTITFLEIYEEGLCQVEGLNFIFSDETEVWEMHCYDTKPYKNQLKIPPQVSVFTKRYISFQMERSMKYINITIYIFKFGIVHLPFCLQKTSQNFEGDS